MKLRRVLVRDYAKLKLRLMRRFGSRDYATELLHDTYLRIGAVDAAVAVRNPEAYLYRVALSVAADNSRNDRRQIDKATIEALRRRDDAELDPEHIVAVREEWTSLLRALDELPQRRREIFIAARLDECTHREIADRFGVSVDTVERELKQALEFFAKRLQKRWHTKRGPKAAKPS